MTSEERIREYLAQRVNNGFCDDCLSIKLAIRPRQQVQQKTYRLGQQYGFSRERDRCSSCGREKLAIRARQPLGAFAPLI